MKKLLPVLGVAAVTLAVASPAAAQPSADTIVTFTVATANLTIEVPASVNLGSAFPGGRLVGQMGVVTVRDQRAAATATWVAQVVASDFRTDDGEPSEIIPPQLVEYWSGPAVATTGTGVFVPGQPTRDERVTLSEPRVAFSKTSGSGNNTASWNPTLEITIPPGAVGGLYVGTVTHSVS
ncbi:hypothetical protein O7626_26925 [Micromonospora sp. WMMD1102]|uniref:hypothetical protein n=1 Tax=Micromonospora sp. WMMD1102 TaxID=3016105 RepID=UPI002414D66A|nr:hypothetical protein [Micromonospora sp. WMMD1102]MDG4789513.1 hypothetical protein [Micromonospora sp. WMMD1102]